MSEPIEARVLRGDILKTLYYKSAFTARTQLGAHTIWVILKEAGHHENGEPISRESLERFVDGLAAKGLIEKIIPTVTGRLLTDYEVFLTRKGRGLLDGVLSDPDIIAGDV